MNIENTTPLNNTQIDSAEAAGVLDAPTAMALRAHLNANIAAPQSNTNSEENFRLINGFNDIFVVTASLLLLIAVGWLTTRLNSSIGGLSVATVAWGLSEFFVLKRRMALPAIVLLIAFLSGIYFAIQTPILAQFDKDGFANLAYSGYLFALPSFATALVAWAHWRRFKVPMTIAATALMAAICLMTLVPSTLFKPILLIVGVAILGLAIRFDAQDVKRITQKADIAFWLHLVAAAVIVQALFFTEGSLYNGVGLTRALFIVGLYLVLAIISLILDRRALLVSALAYVLFSIASLFKTLGANDVALAFSAVIIGSSLLVLSAYWLPCRLFVMRFIPKQLQAYFASI